MTEEDLDEKIRENVRLFGLAFVLYKLDEDGKSYTAEVINPETVFIKEKVN